MASLLQYWGNPDNMGICVACFKRDIAGAVGLHSAAMLQYMRPEIIGLVWGALVAALIHREFNPTDGSSPMIRFLLGMFSAVGALVFLGCPWRAILRLAGGDWNALIGIFGLIAGIWVGGLFFKRGFNLGPAKPAAKIVGWIFPVMLIGLLLLSLIYPQLPKESQHGVLFYSMDGPGSKHAPIFISLIVALGIGYIAQRSRFCVIEAIRDMDMILFKYPHMLTGVVAMLLAAFFMNFMLGQFHPGFIAQPLAHTDGIWNFMGMLLAGLCFSLADGCPGRQLFKSGEGKADAAVFILGLFVGVALSHNFSIAASPAGIGEHSAIAVIIGLIVCGGIGFFMRPK